ncbi:MAG: hypothetical protein HYZ15_12625 [Sphingobacteriales bacterium]|nr:hypothetical protein [Sphingobacteriales bacterium]
MTIIPVELAPAISQSMDIELPATGTLEQLREKLSARINDLINNDFEKLVFHLYRIDVSEARMRALLAQKEGENAAGLIADLIIERQLQKLETRKQFKQPSPGDEHEKW